MQRSETYNRKRHSPCCCKVPQSHKTSNIVFLFLVLAGSKLSIFIITDTAIVHCKHVSVVHHHINLAVITNPIAIINSIDSRISGHIDQHPSIVSLDPV